MRNCAFAVAALTVSLLALSEPARATSLRITCRDGDSTALVRIGRFALEGIAPSRTTQPVCDFDQTCDGACTFAFCSLGEFLCANDPVCVGPASGLCQPGVQPSDEFVVPIRHSELIPMAGLGFDLMLRCRPSAACR